MDGETKQAAQGPKAGAPELKHEKMARESVPASEKASKETKPAVKATAKTESYF